ncbi:potassium channel family protein [Thalassotalea sp. G2M2-11]|uniref:potassium channel family protein n=1 Tax=Thalassotalea sp. G2M2-11 TaxID=2787627 RepID=UPI0019D31845|nr:potassium channel family protein [Thalassotalea sp. G2M2-11]
MISFFLTLTRFFHGLYKAWLSPNFRSTFFLVILILFSGTLFYNKVEGWSLIDSVYFCMMTLSTIGYGDLHPTTDLSKIFTMFYAIVGVGLFVAFLTQIAMAQIKDKDD